MELDAHLMATAANLFIQQGYEGTSMGQIVAAAGAGKQSLYRRYANKEVLFRDVFTNFVMKNIIARADEQLAIFEIEACFDGENDLETLHRFAQRSFDFMIEPETVATLRLFIAEQSRFPDLKNQIQIMIQFIEDDIGRYIRRAQESNLIRLDIDQNVSRNFMALIAEGPLVRALLEISGVSTEENRKSYFDSAWRLFIDSVTVRS